MAMNPETIGDLTNAVRNRHPVGQHLFVRLADCRIRVSTNTSDVAEALREYFAPFSDPGADPADIDITVHEGDPPSLSHPFAMKEPDPGKTRIKEEFFDFPDGRAVRKRLTGMLFLFGARDHLAVGPCRENINQVVNFINNRYIERVLCQGALLGHAAGIRRNGRGMALAGFSGAGKSTLALRIMAEGAEFVSNDRVMIQRSENGLIMRGVAKQPRINPGTALHQPALARIMDADDLRRFAALSESELWKVEHKYDAVIEDCFGPDRFILSTPMSALTILSWKRGGGPMRVRRVDPGARKPLLSAFIKSPGLFFLPSESCRMPEPSMENYLDYLSGCDVLEFSGGIDFDRAARACITYLETGAL